MKPGEKLKNRRLELGLTLEEVGNIVGVGKSTVTKWENGSIENMKRDKIALLATALKVSPLFIMGIEDAKNVAPLKTKQIPMLGNIAAGVPTLAYEGASAYIEVDSSTDVDFCLRVSGDSMIDARIHDGDIVFVRKQETVENGEIAVVLIGDEATLKRFYKNNGGVILKPENSNYQPHHYTESDFKDVKILGKAISFQSKI